MTQGLDPLRQPRRPAPLPVREMMLFILYHDQHDPDGVQRWRWDFRPGVMHRRDERGTSQRATARRCTHCRPPVTARTR